MGHFFVGGFYFLIVLDVARFLAQIELWFCFLFWNYNQHTRKLDFLRYGDPHVLIGVAGGLMIMLAHPVQFLVDNIRRYNFPCDIMPIFLFYLHNRFALLPPSSYLIEIVYNEILILSVNYFTVLL